MVEQVVGLKFVVDGEAQATAAIKRVSQSQDKLRNDILRGADALQRIQSNWDKTNRLLDQGTINTKAAARSQVILAREYALLNGYVKSNGALNTQRALAEMRAAQATREAAQAAATAAANQQRLKQSYDTLLASINPTIAAQQRMRQTQQMLRAAVDSGAISAAQAAAALRQYRDAAQAAGAAGNMAARRTNQLGVLFQQTGYQVGDFAVQVQGGTNVMVALGQQATQLVGTFGMLAKSTRMIGVFAGLGILIPILTGVGAYFLRMRDSANEAAKAADTLGESIKSLDSTLADFVRTRKAAEAGVTVEELLGTEGLEKASADLAEAEDRLNRLVTSSQATPTGMFAGVAVVDYIMQARAIKGTEAALEDVIAARTRLQLLEEKAASERAENFVTESAELRRQIELQRLSLQFGSDSAQVRAAEIEQQIIALRKRDDLDEGAKAHIEAQIRLSAQLAEEIIRVEGASEDVSDAVSNIANEMSRAANEALLFISNLESGGGVNAARARVAGLRAELGARQGGADDIAAAAARAEAEVRSRPEFQLGLTGPEGLRQETLAGLQREIEKARLDAEAGIISSEISGLGRTDSPTGGSGASNVVDITAILDARRQQIEQERVLLGLTGQQREAQAIYFDLLKQNEDAVNRLTDAELMGAANVLAAEQEKNRVIEEGLKRQQDIYNTLESSMERSLMSIVDGTASVKDAFRSMASEITKELYRVLVVQRLVGSASGGTGIAGFISGLFANGAAFNNGNVVPFANGGVVGSPTTFPMAGGKTGLMGEAGPEAIMPLKRGKDGKLGVAADGGGAVTVNNYFSVQANGDDSVKRIVRQQIPQIAEATKAAVVDAKRRGGSYGRAFG